MINERSVSHRVISDGRRTDHTAESQ